MFDLGIPVVDMLGSGIPVVDMLGLGIPVVDMFDFDILEHIGDIRCY
jgi:hypothetical protein